MVKVKVIKNEEKPESTQILAEAIIKISEAMEKLSKESGLSEEALVILIQANSKGLSSGGKPSKTTVRVILKSMSTLKGYYLRDKQ